jgi:Transposase, Mutator family
VDTARLRGKAVLTESGGDVAIDVPSDRTGTFEPQIALKRQRRLPGADQIALSLYAKRLTTGEIGAHFAAIYGASCHARRWARQPFDVTIVAGSVQLSKDGEAIRVHPIRHDRCRELDAFANPKGRPRRKNSTIGYIS